jgi:hypothetical protein
MDRQEEALELGTPLETTDDREHVETYKAFTRTMAVAALIAPFFFAFVLYWTT